jgi:undecaprenyl pyrophosphate phosphatase UppP
MYIKEIILFIFAVVFGGVVGYLYYLYFEKKKVKDKEKSHKRELILASIFNFVAVALCGFFISRTDNYFYMFLIFIGVIMGTALILGLLLIILKKTTRRKNNSKEDTV